jgi:hypothetical protein
MTKKKPANTGERLAKTAAIELAQNILRGMLKENPYPGEGHFLRREVLIEKALSPSSSNWLIDRADGTKEVVYEKMPLWMSEGRKVPADYDDEKGWVIVGRALRGDADSDAALCEIASQHIRWGRRLPPLGHLHPEALAT